jgi:hypothetical protein
VTFEDNFDTLDFNKYDVGSSEEVLQVQLNAPTKLKGIDIT